MFKNENVISQTPEGKDNLYVSFKSSDQVLTLNSNFSSEQLLEPYEITSIPVMPIGEKNEELEQFINNVSKTCVAIIVILTVLGPFAGKAIGKLWSMMNHLVLIFYFVLIDVQNIPGNVYQFQMSLSFIH